MKKALFLLILAVASHISFAQTDSLSTPPKQISLGLDVFQSIPSFVLREKYFTHNTLVVEPTLRMNGKLPRKFILLSAGYVNGSTTKNPMYPGTRENFQGIYFKAGFETSHTRFPLRIGYGPLVSWSVYSGRHLFEGPVFGDYKHHFRYNNLAAGVHGYLGYDFTTGKKSFIRISGQISTALRMGELEPSYYPGMGVSVSSDLIIYATGGITAQFFYRIR